MHRNSVYLAAVLLIVAMRVSDTVSAAEDRLPYGFPVYAVDAACNALFAMAPDEDRRSNIRTCLDQEQKALDLLKARWKNAANKIEEMCEPVSRGSYLRLYQCVLLKEKQDKSPLQIISKHHDLSSANH